MSLKVIAASILLIICKTDLELSVGYSFRHMQGQETQTNLRMYLKY